MNVKRLFHKAAIYISMLSFVLTCLIFNTQGITGRAETATEGTISTDNPTESIQVSVNGKTLDLDVKPQEIENRILVPVRGIFEALGAQVQWDEDTRTVVGTDEKHKVVLTIDSTEATVNGKIERLDVPAMSIHNRTMVPARFISESFGAEVQWDQGTKTVVINTAPLTKYLNNTLDKIQKDKTLNIGYFGGSITKGDGASNPDLTSWRALTTEWFRKKYPECNIQEIQAAIGGTGSDLGTFRCRNDLLIKKPDLVFVEFAVNDLANPKLSSRCMEGIVRQIWEENPLADIVFVYTATKFTMGSYSSGALPGTVAAQQEIADYYRIPSVNIGKVLWENAKKDNIPLEKLLPDGVHPNDAGYVIYADGVKSFLEALLSADKPVPAPKTMPGPYNVDFMKGSLSDAWETAQCGWVKEDKPLNRFYPHLLTCGQPGTELSYHFTGTIIGLYWLMSSDSGDIEWSIDGGESKKTSSWDTTALQYAHTGYRILAEGLENKEHTLKIKILSEKQSQSKGNWIRIGAFLVDSQPESKQMPTVYLIGDSIVADYSKTYNYPYTDKYTANYYPQAGWGQELGKRFYKDILIKNYGIGGKSSKSFLETDQWTAISKSLQKGDYLLIQFGHNDKSKDPAIGTEPNTTYKQNLGIYVQAAKEKGAIPILVTPPSTFQFENGVAANTLGDFSQAMRDYAKENKVLIIDLNAKALALYNSLGENGCKDHLFMFRLAAKKLLTEQQLAVHPNTAARTGDSTHYTIEGAGKLADLIVQGIRELKLPIENQIKTMKAKFT